MDAFQQIKLRISEIEGHIIRLEKEIPCRSVRKELDAWKTLLQANIDAQHLFFGESSLNH